MMPSFHVGLLGFLGLQSGFTCRFRAAPANPAAAAANLVVAVSAYFF